MSQDPTITGLVIRRSTSADTASLWRCVDAVARERRWLARVEAAPIEQTRSYLARQGIIHFVASRKSEVVGWCDVTPKSKEGMRHTGELGMGLLKEFRGRGLGTRLMEATLSAARAAGLTRIELEVWASNERAIALYERRGFVHEGRKRSARILDGRIDDMLCMALIDSAGDDSQ